LEIRFVERKELIPKKFVLINALPDVGLVGVIAATHLISSLKMKEIAYLDSEVFPPIIVLHEGEPKSPIRILANDSLAILISETAVPAEAIYPLANAIVNWASSKNVEYMISLGGLAVQNRQDIDSPKVFAVLTDKKLMNIVGDSAELMEEGYIVGAYALMIKKCMEIKLPAITLLAQSFFSYPDPEAAAATIKVLNKILNLNVDVSELLQRGEEIRLRAKDIMRRTQAELIKMNKAQEYDLPPLYM
jgi:uncharacterized protein